MLINLTDVFTEEGKSVAREVLLELETISFQGEEYRIVEKTPVAIKLTNIKPGRAMIEADVTVTTAHVCDRCLKNVNHEFNLHIAEEAVSPETVDTDEEAEAQEFMEGYQLNVDSLVSNEIFTCWPMKILCREDCKGLCKVCGKDLNEGDCGCDSFVPDPRMAAIMDIFRENKEV